VDSAYDVRPVVKEQVESVGGKFIVLDVDSKTSEDKGGYAKAMDESFYRRQRELMTEVIREQDVLIATAAVPGRKAPILVTRDMVLAMQSGSVIVDIAAERGGNCEVTRPGESIVEQGVLVLGPLNVPSMVPYHASQMYSSNITSFIKLLFKNGSLNIDLEDEIIRETLVTHESKIVHSRVLEAMQSQLGASVAR
jgi:NAD(P) transhydrogenase subunit alpha